MAEKSKEKILEEYIAFRKLKNHTDAINDVHNQISKFINFKNKPLSEFDEQMLIAHLANLPKYKTNYLNANKVNLKNFIKWFGNQLKEQDFKEWTFKFRNLDKICETEKPANAYKPEDMIKEADFQKLIKGEESHFWKAYFLTLWYSSSRPIEICELKKDKVEFDKEGGAYITIHSEKNKEDFIKYIPEDAAFYLKDLMKNSSEYVFFNEKTKKPIGVKGAYWKIRELSQRVLGYKLDLYTLRHSIATINYTKEYVKDTDIARQMGHSKSMKNKYVHNDKEKLKAIAKKIYIKPEDLPAEQKHELFVIIDTINNVLINQSELLELFILKEQNKISKKEFDKNIIEKYPKFMTAGKRALQLAQNRKINIA